MASVLQGPDVATPVEFQAVGRPCCVSEISGLYSLGHSGRGGRGLLVWEGLIPAGWTTHPLVLIPGAQPSPHMVLLHSGPVSSDAHFLMPRAVDCWTVDSGTDQ